MLLSCTHNTKYESTGALLGHVRYEKKIHVHSYTTQQQVKVRWWCFNNQIKTIDVYDSTATIKYNAPSTAFSTKPEYSTTVQYNSSTTTTHMTRQVTCVRWCVPLLHYYHQQYHIKSYYIAPHMIQMIPSSLSTKKPTKNQKSSSSLIITCCPARSPPPRQTPAAAPRCFYTPPAHRSARRSAGW